jgi:glutaredoxin
MKFILLFLLLWCSYVIAEDLIPVPPRGEIITIYTATWCSVCQRLHEAVKNYHKHPIKYIDIGNTRMTIPRTVYKGKEYIGFDTFENWNKFIEDIDSGN